MENEDELQLLLGTQFQGIEEARQYASAMERVARAETKAAESIIKAATAQKELNRSRGETPAAMGPLLNLPLRDLPPAPKEDTTPREPRQAPLPLGPHQRLLKAGEDFDRAKESGSVAQIADAHYALRRAQDRAEQAQRGAMSPAAQALYSMRLNLPGGAAPLLGKGLEAVVGKEKAIALVEAFGSKLMPLVSKAGPIGLLASASVAAAKGMLDLSEQAAKTVNAYTEAQATLGGSMSDVARVKMVGSPSAARSFSERISTDPMAMSAAAQVGVHQMKMPYGDPNFTRGYLQAIERVSKIADASQRRRLALMLGIEQEVAQWSLLSEASQRRLKDAADIAGQMSDPQAQKGAAEFEASRKLVESAVSNFMVAAGNLFGPTITEFFNDTADLLNGVAKTIKDSEAIGKVILGTAISGLPGGQVFGMSLMKDGVKSKFSTPDAPLTNGGVSDEKTGLLAANTQAMVANTEAMQRLTQNIGGGPRAREATERLRAFGGATGFSQQARADFRMGALG